MAVRVIRNLANLNEAGDRQLARKIDRALIARLPLQLQPTGKRVRQVEDGITLGCAELEIGESIAPIPAHHDEIPIIEAQSVHYENGNLLRLRHVKDEPGSLLRFRERCPDRLDGARDRFACNERDVANG